MTAELKKPPHKISPLARVTGYGNNSRGEPSIDVNTACSPLAFDSRVARDIKTWSSTAHSKAEKAARAKVKPISSFPKFTPGVVYADGYE